VQILISGVRFSSIEAVIVIFRSIYSDPIWHSASHPAGAIGLIFQSPQIKRS
jgi:hypothetical protein